MYSLILSVYPKTFILGHSFFISSSSILFLPAIKVIFISSSFDISFNKSMEQGNKPKPPPITSISFFLFNCLITFFSLKSCFTGIPLTIIFSLGKFLSIKNFFVFSLPTKYISVFSHIHSSFTPKSVI